VQFQCHLEFTSLRADSQYCVLVGLEVAMVTLALAVAHSLAVADVKTVSSENSVAHSDSSS